MIDVLDRSLRASSLTLPGLASEWDASPTGGDPLASVKDFYTEKARERYCEWHATPPKGTHHCVYCKHSFAGMYADMVEHEARCSLSHLRSDMIGHKICKDDDPNSSTFGEDRVVLTFPGIWNKLAGVEDGCTSADDSLSYARIKRLTAEVGQSAGRRCSTGVASDGPVPPDFGEFLSALAKRHAAWADVRVRDHTAAGCKMVAKWADASQVVRAYRAEVKALEGTTKEDLKAALRVLEQVRYEADLAELKEQGVNFEDWYYIPEVNPVTGHPLVAHEDMPHKGKNVATSLRRQNGDDLDYAVNKQQILESIAGACRRNCRHAHGHVCEQACDHGKTCTEACPQAWTVSQRSGCS